MRLPTEEAAGLGLGDLIGFLPDDFCGFDILEGHRNHIANRSGTVAPVIKTADAAFKNIICPELPRTLGSFGRIDHTAFLLILYLSGNVGPAGGIDETEETGIQDLLADERTDCPGVDTGVGNRGGIEAKGDDHDRRGCITTRDARHVAGGEHGVDHRLNELVYVGLPQAEGLDGGIGRVGAFDRAGAASEQEHATQRKKHEKLHVWFIVGAYIDGQKG